MKNKIVLELVIENNQIQSVKVKKQDKRSSCEQIRSRSKRQRDRLIGINEIAKLFTVTTWTINDWIRSSIFPPCDVIIKRKPFWIKEIILPEIEFFLKFRENRSKTNIRLEYLNYIKKCASKCQEIDTSTTSNL